MPTDTIPALVADVAAIDWNDLAAVAATSDKLLAAATPTPSTAPTTLGTGDIDVAALRPRVVRTESTGDFYTLHQLGSYSVMRARRGSTAATSSGSLVSTT